MVYFALFYMLATYRAFLCFGAISAHHDFGFARLEDEHQAARFSTLLLYLNEPEKGGETAFPRWANAETFKELAVHPEVGKAVLFYSQLPDGNFDDLSHHAGSCLRFFFMDSLFCYSCSLTFLDANSVSQARYYRGKVFNESLDLGSSVRMSKQNLDDSLT